MVTEFFMAIKPPTCTYQQHRVKKVDGRLLFYDPPEVKAARSKLRAHLSGHIPEEKYIVPVRLTTKWCFPKGRHKNGEYRGTKPDTDNLQKMLKDVMSDLGFWKDDCLVASEITEKFWADLPGIYIKIESLQPKEKNV